MPETTSRPPLRRPDMPDVSVVFVSWNTRELLQASIASVAQNSCGLSIEVIVVDNASTDGTVEALRAGNPNVRLISNRENRGFAPANNQGLKIAKGRFIFFLNPDTLVVDDCLQQMARYLDQHPEVGAVGPRLCYPNGEIQIPSARKAYSLGAALWLDSFRFHTLPLVGKWFLRRYMSSYDYSKTQNVEAISGAGMFLRSEIAKAMQGFDESYLHCGEDLDLCARIRNAGHGIAYLSEAVVVHYFGQSTKQAPVRTKINQVLSDQMLVRRMYGDRYAWMYRFVVSCVQVSVLLIVGFVKLCTHVESKKEFSYRKSVALGLLRWKKIEG
jgi:GT2 family glycosyltransferase